MAKNRLNDIVMEIYRELYANCVNPVNFDLLVAASDVDEQGRKVIPYLDYEIDADLFDEIVTKIMKRHRLKQHQKTIVKWNVYMGCSPKTIHKDDVRASVTDSAEDLTATFEAKYVTTNE